jgi:hypothetical protein
MADAVPGAKPVQKGGQQIDMAAIQADINAVSTRARLAEERTADMQRRIQFLEQQMLANHRKAGTEMKLLHDDIMELKRQNSEMQNRIMMLIKELQLTARKEDIDVVSKYLALWEPVNFVTANTVRRIVKDELAKTVPVPEVSVEH